jgi:hypothetical protein
VEQPLAGLCQVGEDGDVGLLPAQQQPVGALGVLQQAGVVAELAAQPGHLHLHRVAGASGRVVAPQGVGQRVGRHSAALGEGEVSQQQPVQPPGHRHRLAVPPDGHRAEQPNHQPGSGVRISGGHRVAASSGAHGTPMPLG